MAPLISTFPPLAPTAANDIDDDRDDAIDEDLWDGIDNDGDCPGDTDGDGRICDRGNVGVDEDQAHFFIHELGRAVGLRHGGGDHSHYKPNYLSVVILVLSLRCAFQSSGRPPGLV